MEDDLLYLGVNQDSTLILAASDNGFKVFSLAPFELINQDNIGSFQIIDIYERTQFLLLVGSREQASFSPKRLTVWNIAERSPICETSFPEAILSVKMNFIRIVAVIVDSIYIYNTSTMKTQNVIRTVDNPKGLVALSPNQAVCYLLYPSSQNKGHLHIYDCYSMQTQGHIEAHKSPLSAVEISYLGHICCTASVKGTVIRVFSLPEGQKLYNFKRGLAQADTFGLRFSRDSQFLISCGSTGTIHVFDLRNRGEGNWKKKIFDMAGHCLPEGYRDSWNVVRDIVSIKTGFCQKFVAAISCDNTKIVAVSYSQEFLVYSVELDRGEVSVVASGKLNRVVQTQRKVRRD